jgi:DNA polymerase-1
VLALISGSSTLREIFQQGIDLHGRTGQKIFGVSPELQDGSLHRLPSKTTNFSIIMGTTGIGLAEQQRKNGYPFPELQGAKFQTIKDLHMAQAEVCQSWVDTIIKDWDIGPHIASTHAEARRYGYVRDLWGRRRFLPGVHSPNKQIKERSLREAQAFGPQAGARGFYKIIVTRVWREIIRPLNREGVYLEPLLDLHDDLILEFQSDISGWLEPLVTDTFNHTFQEQIPITCKSHLGQKWSEL